MTEIMCLNGHGKYQDPYSRRDAINYILNFQKMPNRHFNGRGVNVFNAAKDMDDVAEKFDKTSGVQLRHYILSFDPTEVRDPCLAFVISCHFMDYFAQKYQVIFAVHENTANLHTHFIVHSVSYLDGGKFRGTKADHYEMMQTLRHILKYFGLKELRYVSKLTEDFGL